MLHPRVGPGVEQLRVALPQSMLLHGPSGVGLLTIAKWLAGDQLTNLLHPQDAKEHTDSEEGTITIEMIRRLYDQTRAKQTRRQVIIIDNADRMSSGAQNAFLKLLEEPNAQFHFLLTSHSPQKLLPTIRSRVQPTLITPISPTQTADFLVTLGIIDPKRQAQLHFIAEGLPAELTRLAEDADYFTKRAEIVGDARDLLQADTYKKLLVIQKYKTKRAEAIQLVETAMQILRRSMSAKPQQSIALQLDQLLVVKERIASNHNAMLQLTQFVL